MSCYERILTELTTVRISRKLLEKYRLTNAVSKPGERISLSRLLEDALRAELARRYDSSKEV